MRNNFFGTNLKRIIFLISILILLYLFVYPIVSPTFIPYYHVTDIDFYKEEKYLKHKYGSEFKEYLSSFELLNNGEVVGFYYGDNYKYDSLVYGRIPDIIAVDIKLDDNLYAILKNSETTKEYDHYIFNDSYRYEFYYPNEFSGQHFQTFFALNDQDKIFRGIIITDTEDFEFPSSLTGFMRRWTQITFE